MSARTVTQVTTTTGRPGVSVTRRVIGLRALVLILTVVLFGLGGGLVSIWAPSLSFAQSTGNARTGVSPACSPDWQIVSSPSPGTSYNELTSLAVGSSTDVWAVGDYADGTLGQGLAVHWDGTQWNLVTTPYLGNSSGLFGVAEISSSDVWAVGTIANYGTLTEHWDGTQWTAVPSPNPAGGEIRLRSVAAVSSTDVWAVGYYVNMQGQWQTLTEHWDGTQWSIAPSPSPGTGTGANWLVSVAAVSSNDVWAVGSYDAGSGQRGLLEHWDGAQWTVFPGPPEATGANDLYAVDALSSTDVWAVGRYGSQTLTEHWDGTQWHVVTSLNAGTNYNELYSVAAVSSTDVWAVGDYQGPGVQQTLVEHWDGTQWSIMPSPSAGTGLNQLYSVAAVSPTDVWSVGYYFDSSGLGQTLAERYNPCPPSPSSTPTSTPTVTGTPPTATPTPTCSAGLGMMIYSGMTTGYGGYSWTQTLAANSVNYTWGMSHTAPNDYAIFQTHDPWGYTVIKTAITGAGHTYSVFTPSQLSGFDFSGYRVVVLNWDDTNVNDFDPPYSSVIPQLEAYVQNGGVVWVQGAIQAGGGTSYLLPFGGTASIDFSSSDPIADTSHPLAQGLPNPVTGDYANQTSVTGEPTSAHMVIANGNDQTATLYVYQPGMPCATATNTAVPPTSTATNTPQPPTGTPTNTPTATNPPTDTSTPIPPTNTPTSTPALATNTPNSTATPSQGCAPAFWQGSLGVQLWDQVNDPDWTSHGGTGTNPYETTTQFNGFFTPYAGFGSMTMLQILGTGGRNDAARKAARDVVAGYLNASFGINYPYSTSQIAGMWASAVSSGNFKTLYNLLDAANSRQCPIQ